jgi:hypothetical protein
MKTKTLISLVVAGIVLFFGGITIGRYSTGTSAVSLGNKSAPPTFEEVEKSCPELMFKIRSFFDSKGETGEIKKTNGTMNTIAGVPGYMMTLSTKQLGEGAEYSVSFTHSERGWQEINWFENIQPDNKYCVIR